jgi:hypothetical protein
VATETDETQGRGPGQTIVASFDGRTAWEAIKQRKGPVMMLDKKTGLDSRCFTLGTYSQNTNLRVVVGGGKKLPFKKVMMSCLIGECPVPGKYTVFALCGDKVCCNPGHHIYVPTLEVYQRECCSAAVLCRSCRRVTPYPCLHTPPCQIVRWTNLKTCNGCSRKSERRGTD